MIKPTQSGVAILFAILLVSIVLTVGLTLLNITLRQLILSSLARESQFAFYASDSARGCARHYDSLGDQSPFGYFGVDSSGGLSLLGLPNSNPMNCGNGPVTVNTPEVSLGAPSRSDFTVIFNDGTKNTCATVTVFKYQSSSPDLNVGLGKTKIISRGYNNYDSSNPNGCYKNTERTVERAATMLY